MIQYYQNDKAPTLEETYDASISASTSITLNTSATYIEVTAMEKGVCLKWGGTASTSDYDEFIAPNTTRVYPIPNDPVTNAKHLTVQFIEESASARLSVIEK